MEHPETTGSIASVESSERLFWPRVSEAVVEFAHVIAQDPEVALSDEQKQEALVFEKELFEGRYGDIPHASSLRERAAASDTDFRIAPEFFTTEDGLEVLRQSLDVKDIDLATVEAATEYLRSRPIETYADPKVLKALQMKSLAYVREQYAAMAMGDALEHDIRLIELSPDPNDVLAKLSSFDHYRRFLRLVRHDLRARLKTDDSEVDKQTTAAKLMITSIYRDKISTRMAESLPILVELSAQIEAAGISIDSTLAPRLMDVARKVAADGDRKTQFLRLLDYVRNGAAIDENGKYTPLDAQLWDVALEVNDANEQGVGTANPVFNHDEVEAFKNYFFDADEMETFMNAYNERIGVTEEGWGAEKAEEKNSFSVYGPSKKIKIPAKYHRAVAGTFPVVGIVGLISHEVGGSKPGHVFQSLNTARNEATLELGTNIKYRGKRFLGLREAGGVLAEADAIARYFGQTRRVNLAYAEAMKTMLEGGSDAAAVRSFAEAQLADLIDPTDDQRKQAYTLAADRILRLLRYGRHNSQPLQYVEGARVRQVAETLDAHVVDTMLGEAIFDPVDMMRLHKFGLLPTDTDHFFKPKEDPEKVMVDLLREKLKSVQ